MGVIIQHAGGIRITLIGMLGVQVGFVNTTATRQVAIGGPLNGRMWSGGVSEGQALHLYHRRHCGGLHPAVWGGIHGNVTGFVMAVVSMSSTHCNVVAVNRHGHPLGGSASDRRARGYAASGRAGLGSCPAEEIGITPRDPFQAVGLGPVRNMLPTDLLRTLGLRNGSSGGVTALRGAGGDRPLLGGGLNSLPEVGGGGEGVPSQGADDNVRHSNLHSRVDM